MKLITLIENELGSNPNLTCEFGFSIFIEDEDTNLIFDTGQSGIFVENIKKLGIDTKKIDKLIISHNHFDHGGGVKNYINFFGNNFSIYLNKKFFYKRYGFSKEYSRILGANFSEDFLKKKDVKINFITDHIHNISKNITIFTNFKNITNFENLNSTYFKKVENNFIFDDMSDELVLGLNTSKGYIILCGCSHFGIVNIVENIKLLTGKKIIGIIGGLHLSKASDERVKKVINYLKNENINYLALSHCTGEKTIEILKREGFTIISNHTGNILEL